MFPAIFNVLNGTILFEFLAFVENVFIFIASSFSLVILDLFPIK
jgi:hypothetical protein